MMAGLVKQMHTKFIKVLSVSSRRKYVHMVVLSIANAMLELFGVSILLYTILAIFEPSFIENFWFTGYLQKTFRIAENQVLIFYLTSFLLVLYVFKNILLIQMNKKQIKLSYAINCQVTDDYYHRLIQRSFQYFNANLSSSVLNEIVSVTFNFSENVLLSSVLFISEWFIVLSILGVILLFQPWLFLFVCVALIPTAVLMVFLNKKSIAKMSEDEHHLIPKVYTNIQSLVRGIATIKLWGGEAYFLEQYKKIRKQVYSIKQKLYLKSHFVPVRTYEVISVGGLWCIVAYGVYIHLNVSTIVAYISIYAAAAFRLLPSINRIITSSNNLTSKSHVLDFLIEHHLDARDIEDTKQVVFQDYIALKEVSFAHTGEAPVLKNCSIQIYKGSFVGLSGISGAGKSTILNLVSSLLIPQSGILEVDGKSIDQTNRSSYRYLFSYVNQDVFMLNATILENVAFLDLKPDLNRVKACLNQVNLWTWVQDLPEQLNTFIGEQGNQISGGQRQRIAIARALYKQSEFFLLDEVTNNLDQRSKNQVLKTIEELKSMGKTAIIVSHNSDELKLCDSIYELEGGKLSLK